MKKNSFNLSRPYLVIPKLIEQPTWGGSYIVETKGWQDRSGHDIKIGQSYELFSGSNLSLLASSDDPAFEGEITDRDAVQVQTHPEGSIALAELVASNPELVLGQTVVSERGSEIALLIKFTQALGNSFQTHIRDGVEHPKWKPKPESWYYFEPGLLTFGIKASADWRAYEQALRDIQDGMEKISNSVKNKALSYREARKQIDELITEYDPWQFVNTVAVSKDQIVDLSAGGIHHSWEEDPKQAPLGNVLLELQGEAMDDISTFRSFDKGKMGEDGSIRDVHLQQYFDVIDRSPEANDPASHIYEAKSTMSHDENHYLKELMRSRLYNLDKLTLHAAGARYSEKCARYKHLFVQSGSVSVSSGDTTLTVTTGHACFVPAACDELTIQSLSAGSEILISY